MLELREKNGPGAIAELIKPEIESSSSNVILAPPPPPPPPLKNLEM